MTAARLVLPRDAVLAHRRRAGALDARLPAGAASVAVAARAGLQDSMPRAALLSVHARVEGTPPTAWQDPPLVQVWGPRFSAYAVAESDAPIFTVGRTSERPARRRLGEDLAERLAALIGDGAMDAVSAGRALGVDANALRYATPTGRLRITWDGARQPVIRIVPRPEIEPVAARFELARRYLHVLGPGTAEGFSAWAGIQPETAASTFAALTRELIPVRTPIGDAWALVTDEASLRGPTPPSLGARLLPSGDAFTLHQGADRGLLVPDPALRDRLWTPRVWPGAILLGGDIAGTWRRAGAVVTAEPWRPLTDDERAAVETEATSLPLPGVPEPVRVVWAS